jgi:hypothetical protein
MVDWTAGMAGAAGPGIRKRLLLMLSGLYFAVHNEA